MTTCFVCLRPAPVSYSEIDAFFCLSAGVGPKILIQSGAFPMRTDSVLLCSSQIWVRFGIDIGEDGVIVDSPIVALWRAETRSVNVWNPVYLGSYLWDC